MTIRVWPVDAVSGAPSYTGRALRQTTVSPFIALGSTARPLGVRSGVRPGTPVSTASISGTTWSCGPHIGVVDVEAAAEAGGYAYSVDAAVTGTTQAADASSVRTDLVYGQLSDPAESDGTTTPKFDVLYLKNPSTGLTVPAAPARSIPLIKVNVPVAGGGNPTVEWIAPYTAAAGAPIPFLTLAQLQAWTTNVPPSQKANVFADPTTANNGDYLWSGGTWVGGSTTTDIALTMQGIYKLGSPPASAYTQGGHVYMEGMISNSSTAIFVAATLYNAATIPTAFAPANDRWFPLNWGSDGGGGLFVGANGNIGFQLAEDGGSLGANVLRVSVSGANWRMKGV